ncbi:hypothetical protein BECAL_01148 [Bellilinea caldifistulae]|uniref:Uncharacterized protein n=1 Tax=Bellilinea caldifistulae TaxID=360411 RepID=A0A0P6XMW5_9CHLR|nr:hypothetical protein [Bellilinea caldifistulae]KPL77766.1 hypothetical protein AC812_02660 [Bellilinea caldifistulae]GAP09994.1 hypothetical protein BECAL_01148 [Bellilinea caldifistulae]
MELQLLPLISYFIAAAYLAAWLFHQSWALVGQLRAWIFHHKAAGRVLSLSALRETNDRFGILLKILAAAIGIFIANRAVIWISREWLILVLVAAAVLSEEFRPSRIAINLLAVTVLMDRIHVYTESGNDLFEVLSRAVQDLPEGEVQQALREALHRRRSGLAAQECLALLSGIDPHLDEFVLTLKHINLQTGPVLVQVADRLHQRAGRGWDRASRFMLTKEHVWPYLRILRAAIVAAIIVLDYNGVSLHFNAWPSHITALWLGLGLIAAGLLLYFILTSSWPRRVLAVFLLLLVSFPVMNRIGIQSPWWLQLKTVTHVSENLMASESMVGVSVSQEQVQTGHKGFPEQELLSRSNLSSVLLPVPTPSMTITNTDTTTYSLPSKVSEADLEELCCHRIYQPR